MKTIYIRGGLQTNTAVKVLTQLLTEKGHKVVRKFAADFDVVVCWGLSHSTFGPTLNAFVNQYDKLEAFAMFDRLKVPHPTVVAMYEDEYEALHYPVLARKLHHAKGKDIVVCQNFRELEQVIARGKHAFFSEWIPTQTEYRVWVFQNRALAVYEKEYKGGGEYQGYMRNHRFGFRFEKRDNLRELQELIVPSINAVKALDMDFGAVDVLLGKDGKFYVLEVNSKPHIDSPERSSGIRLANAISKWAEGQV